MARPLYCAGCGKQLLITKKALPSKHEVINLVNPHECVIDAVGTEEVVFKEATSEEKKSVEELFESFNFVKKLNKDEEMDKEKYGPEVAGPGDRRPKEHLREEVQTSTAPEGIRANTPGAVKKLGDDPRTITIED